MYIFIKRKIERRDITNKSVWLKQVERLMIWKKRIETKIVRILLGKKECGSFQGYLPKGIVCDH